MDMLDVKGGPLVFEVNSSPSIREAEAACGVDVAGRIVERALELAAPQAAPVHRPGRPARRPERARPEPAPGGRECVASPDGP